MIIYLFDINGTLAPADSTMNSEFQTFFLDWMKDKHVVLTSKSGKSFIVSRLAHQFGPHLREFIMKTPNYYIEAVQGQMQNLYL